MRRTSVTASSIAAAIPRLADARGQQSQLQLQRGQPLAKVLVQAVCHGPPIGFAPGTAPRRDTPVVLGEVAQRQVRQRQEQLGLGLWTKHPAATQLGLEAPAIRAQQLEFDQQRLTPAKGGGHQPLPAVAVRRGHAPGEEAAQEGRAVDPELGRGGQVGLIDAAASIQRQVAHGREVEQILVAVARGGEVGLDAPQFLVLLQEFDLLRPQLMLELASRPRSRRPARADRVADMARIRQLRGGTLRRAHGLSGAGVLPIRVVCWLRERAPQHKAPPSPALRASHTWGRGTADGGA